MNHQRNLFYLSPCPLRLSSTSFHSPLTSSNHHHQQLVNLHNRPQPALQNVISTTLLLHTHSPSPRILSLSGQHLLPSTLLLSALPCICSSTSTHSGTAVCAQYFTMASSLLWSYGPKRSPISPTATHTTATRPFHHAVYCTSRFCANASNAAAAICVYAHTQLLPSSQDNSSTKLPARAAAGPILHLTHASYDC